MKTQLRITIYIILIAFVGACTGSKQMYKKGKKLEEAGLVYESTDFYIDALKRNRSNSDAILALKKTGQTVLDELYAKFYQEYSSDRFKEAVYAYQKADKFKNQVEGLGVRMESAAYYEEYYNESKNIYIKNLYSQAEQDLSNEDFEEAEDKFHEIQKLEPKYKNVDELKNFAFVEPKYRLALKAYDNGEFRSAYFHFNEVLQKSGNYKESKELMEISRENAQYTIGFLAFRNSSKVRGIESAISAGIVRDLMNYEDPFLVIIDRSNTDQIISEQKLGMTGIIDQQTAAKAGELLGAKAILVAKIISAERLNGKLKKQSKTGYLGKPVYKTNPQTGKKYKSMVYSKVFYYDYEQSHKVTCTFQYQLVSTETGEILISDVIEKSIDDHIEYSSFNGDTKYLYKGTWNSQTKAATNDKIYNSYTAKKEIDQQLKSRQQIRSVENLSNELNNSISELVAKRIKNFNPEL